MQSKYKKDDVTDYSDCFAYGKYRCSALTEMMCRTCKSCKFYQPKYIYDERVKVLPENYKGSMEYKFEW